MKFALTSHLPGEVNGLFHLNEFQYMNNQNRDVGAIDSSTLSLKMQTYYDF